MRALRVTLIQPGLPKYRVPVFRELASRPGLGVHVVYSQSGNIPNQEPEGFTGEFTRTRTLLVAGRGLIWQGAQLAWASRKRTDVLVLPWNAGCLTLVPAMLRARMQGVGVVLWGHGMSKSESARRFAARKKLLALASSVLFYNNIGARLYVRHGVDPARVFVALNTIDQSGVLAARAEWLEPGKLDEFRRANGLEGTRQVLFVSRLMADNRVDLLIEAARVMREKMPHVRYVVVGKGPDEARLRELAREKGVEDLVRFEGAIYEEDKIAPWFLTSDVFCYPENIGLSILHAFGYGVPVVTSDNLGAQNPEIEAMRDGENGLLYKDGDVEALAGALEKILGDDELRKRLGEEAFRTAHERFSVKNMVDGMEAAIRAAAASSE